MFSFIGGTKGNTFIFIFQLFFFVVFLAISHNENRIIATFVGKKVTAVFQSFSNSVLKT